jgi:hypothetical protein
LPQPAVGYGDRHDLEELTIMTSPADSLQTRIEHTGEEWIVVVNVDGSDHHDSRHPTRADAERAEQALHASVRASAEASDDRAS